MAIAEDPALADELARAAESRAALRRFLSQTDAITRRHGITSQRYNLLLMTASPLDRSGRASIGELAHRLGLGQTAVTELVNRAAGAGLVRRETGSDDRRVTYVSLTPGGRELLVRAFIALRDERNELLERFQEANARLRAATRASAAARARSVRPG